jgi:hypothetical protein
VEYLIEPVNIFLGFFIPFPLRKSEVSQEKNFRKKSLTAADFHGTGPPYPPKKSRANLKIGTDYALTLYYYKIGGLFSNRS